MFNYLDI